MLCYCKIHLAPLLCSCALLLVFKMLPWLKWLQLLCAKHITVRLPCYIIHICFLRDGDLYAALRDCHSAIQLDSNHLKAHFRLAKCLFELSWSKEALDCLQNFKCKFPDSASTTACRALDRDIRDAIISSSKTGKMIVYMAAILSVVRNGFMGFWCHAVFGSANNSGTVEWRVRRRDGRWQFRAWQGGSDKLNTGGHISEQSRIIVLEMQLTTITRPECLLLFDDLFQEA